MSTSAGDSTMGSRDERRGQITGGEATGKAWGFVLVVFAASRLFYLISGALLVEAVPVHPFQSQTLDVPFGTLSIWAHFDGEHYTRIAESGYGATSSTLPSRYDLASPVFFPLYPLLTRSIADLFGGPVSLGALSAYGVLISLVAFCFSLYFVYRIAEEGWGVRAAQGTVLALAFFPTGFFFNAVYTESLFLVLSAGAVWAAGVRKNFFLACLLAGLATATRNVGVLLLFPLVGEWAERRWYGWRTAYLALVPAGLVAYMAYLWWRFGNPLLFYSEQVMWNREPAGANGLTDALRLAYEDALVLFNPANYEPFGLGQLVQVVDETNHLYSLVFLLFALVVLGAGWWLLPTDLWIYGVAILLVPVLFGSATEPLMSVPRFVLVAFPLFIVLGATVLEERRVLVGWLLASAAVSLVFTALFVSWHFVA
jgi:hypothetical protein